MSVFVCLNGGLKGQSRWLCTKAAVAVKSALPSVLLSALPCSPVLGLNWGFYTISCSQVILTVWCSVVSLELPHCVWLRFLQLDDLRLTTIVLINSSHATVGYFCVVGSFFNGSNAFKRAANLV